MENQELMLKLITAQEIIIKLQEENRTLLQQLMHYKEVIERERTRYRNEKDNNRINPEQKEDLIKMMDERERNLMVHRYAELKRMAMRNTDRYEFEGKIYKKSNLPLAVIKSFIKNNPNITSSELLKAFPRELQGSLGTVRPLERVKEIYRDPNLRFYLEEDNLIKVADEVFVVSSQWTSRNIDAFINKANELGYKVEIVKETER